MNNRKWWLIGWWLSVLPAMGWSDEFCLLLAENYHEQLYCELRGMGQGGDLPPLLDFRRNDSMTQALILKRPAARVGIDVVLPKLPPRILPVPAVPEKRLDVQSPASAESPRGNLTCRLEGVELHCGADRYRLVGNRNNRHLADGVLDSDNRMDIPALPDGREKPQGLGVYLVRAYRQYLEKMMEIGLGGSTFSYRKFVYLFEDVTARGLDFSGRFETMFGFLKQDKRRLSVSEQLPDISRLSPDTCEQLDQTLAVCDAGRKNYLFRRAD
ncbi:MAG: hypothetical protein R3E57_07580 [Porticoccaceae bacterium]